MNQKYPKVILTGNSFLFSGQTIGIWTGKGRGNHKIVDIIGQTKHSGIVQMNIPTSWVDVCLFTYKF